MRHRACGSHRAAYAVLALAVLAASCMVRPRADPTRFYVLAASAPDSAAAPGTLAVGLGPITMPGYLQHPMLATRVDGTQIRYAEFDRWAEPLPTLFGSVLGRDVSALLGARIVPYPWSRAAPLDVIVRVDVQAFEVDATGNATLEACWSIHEPGASSVRRDECASIADAAAEHGVNAQVAALGRAVGALATRIASAIRASPRAEPPGGT